MTQSEQINELAAALSKAQGEMQAAVKDKINPFYKSAYADLGSVWDAARPVLSKYGLCVLQTTEVGADGKISLITTLAHNSGQWMKSFLPLNPAKNDSQGVGAAITYLRRYSLSAIVGVVCDEDDDGETAIGRGKASNSYQTQSSEEKLGKHEVKALSDLIGKLDEENTTAFLEWMQKSFQVSFVKDLPRSCFDMCRIALTNKLKYLSDKTSREEVAC